VFRQLPQELPWLAPLYHAEELAFSSLRFVDWAAEHGAVPVVVCAVYLLLSLWVGPWLMAARAPMPCKNQLAVWNLLLAVFSAAGFLRTAPHLLYYIGVHGGWASVCAPAETAFGQGAAGLWVMLFIFSKVPELVDTVFLVLAKKPVIFLHWYHHFTVLLYCAWRLDGVAIRAPPPSPFFSSLSHSLPTANLRPSQAGTRMPRARPRGSTLSR
jgi:elongation of very long chain fatty acids protein 6